MGIPTISQRSCHIYETSQATLDPKPANLLGNITVHTVQLNRAEIKYNCTEQVSRA